MNNSHHDLETVLRTMDPASNAPAQQPGHTATRQGAPSTVLSERAAADLESILASPRDTDLWDPGDSSPAPSRTRSEHPVRRLGLIGALAVGATFLGFFLPGAATSSFAGWTTQPATLTTAQAEQLGDRCAGMHSGLPGLRPVLADQRGGVTLSVLTSDAGHLADCWVGADGAAAGYGPADPEPAMEPGRVVDVADMSSVGFSRSSLGIELPLEDWSSSVLGRADEDVVGIVVHTLAGQAVEASLTDGVWAAWWPTEAGEGSDAQLDLELTVTLTDGTEQQVRVGDVMIDSGFWGG